MGRLFIGGREIALVQSVTKEVIKDIIGQVITYYPISALKTITHATYLEAVHKLFLNPIKINAMVGQPTWEDTTNRFGIEKTSKVEVWVQDKDLVSKRIILAQGDYFVYGDVTYEVVSYVNMNNIYNQAEYNLSWHMVGKMARPGEFDPQQFKIPIAQAKTPFGETGVQSTFSQQRGLPLDAEGNVTGDIREIRDNNPGQFEEIALGEGPMVVDTVPNTVEDENLEVQGPEPVSSFNNDPVIPRRGVYFDSGNDD